MTYDVLRYAPAPGRYDEVIGLDGEARPEWQPVARALGAFDPAVLSSRQRQAERLLDAEGTGHLVHDLTLATDRRGNTHAERAASHPWRLDPIPFVLAADEFRLLAEGVVHRMRALEGLLADCYGPRRLIADGVLPAELLHSLAGYRPVTGDDGARTWLIHYAIDVVRDATGKWNVVQDLTDAPSGLGYALLNRSVMARVMPDGLRAVGAAGVHDHADTLRRALTASAPRGSTSPRAVVLTAGPGDPTYVEHSYLAMRLGIHLVEGADVVMRAGRLWLRVLDGLDPIDVVYRRVVDAQLDPLEPGHLGGGSGVPGLVWGARAGGVTLANAYGSGIAEAPQIAPFLSVAAQHLLGRPLDLPSLTSGAALGTSPVFVGDGDHSVQARPVVLRLHIACVDGEYVVMRGGVGRVLAPGDHPASPTAEMVKDVWVVGAGAPVRPLHVTGPPQVDFGGSVPKRVADALYWLGRAAERAEVAARATSVVTTQLEQDPMLLTLSDGAWTVGAAALLRAARSAPAADRGESAPFDAFVDELAATSAATAVQIAALVQEATSVREYLSVTTGRVLGRLADIHARLVDGRAVPEELDVALVDLAALSGLVMESTVRGPAWRFLDLGRRIERTLAVLGSVEAVLGVVAPPLAEQPLADAVLSANESLVAYRRRYRSEFDLHAVLDLLLRDDANPRSLAYQLDRLREHTAGLAWPEGSALVQDASLQALAMVETAAVNGRRVSLDELVLQVRGPILQLSGAIVARWFADPVNPTVVRGQ